MILVKKASWSASRAVGILLFYITSSSLIGWYTKSVSGYLDIYKPLEEYLGKSSAFLAILAAWFASIYLTLRISYRTILSKVRESVPSFREVRESVLPSREESYEEEAPQKRSKGDDAYKKKAEELEKKLESIQKTREKS